LPADAFAAQNQLLFVSDRVTHLRNE
jgi:hypothetical protein